MSSETSGGSLVWWQSTYFPNTPWFSSSRCCLRRSTSTQQHAIRLRSSICPRCRQLMRLASQTSAVLAPLLAQPCGHARRERLNATVTTMLPSTLRKTQNQLFHAQERGSLFPVVQAVFISSVCPHLKSVPLSSCLAYVRSKGGARHDILSTVVPRSTPWRGISPPCCQRCLEGDNALRSPVGYKVGVIPPDM